RIPTTEEPLMSIRLLITTLMLLGASPALDAQVLAREAPSAPTAVWPAPATPAAAPAPGWGAFSPSASSDGLFGPRLQRFPQDPADSLYRAARTLLNRG